jgi:glycerol uptake facilitator-like aquaporin
MGTCRFVGVTVAGPVSGAHLNPAVTIGLATAGKFSWDLVPSYIAAQMIGGMLGAFLYGSFIRIILRLRKTKAQNWPVSVPVLPSEKHLPILSVKSLEHLSLSL